MTLTNIRVSGRIENELWYNVFIVAFLYSIFVAIVALCAMYSSLLYFSVFVYLSVATSILLRALIWRI
jgi:hypothetical protein